MRAATLHTDQNGIPTEWVQVVPAREWYPVQEASILLMMGTTQIYDCIKRGTITAYEVNNVTHIKHEDMVRYIERRESGQQTTVTGGPQVIRIVPSPRKRTIPTPMEPAIPDTAIVRPMAGTKGAVSQSPGQPPAGWRSHIPLEEPEPVDGLDLDALTLEEDKGTEEGTSTGIE